MSPYRAAVGKFLPAKSSLHLKQQKPRRAKSHERLGGTKRRILLRAGRYFKTNRCWTRPRRVLEFLIFGPRRSARQIHHHIATVKPVTAHRGFTGCVVASAPETGMSYATRLNSF